MTRTIAAALLAVCAVALAAAQADVSGSWTFRIDSPAGSGTRTMELEQDGTAVSGATTGRDGSTAPVSGRVTDAGVVELSFEVAEQGGLLIYLSGTVDGSTMRGSADFGGLASGNFTAERD